MNNSCHSDESCDLLNSLLDSFAPIDAKTAYLKSYEALDISNVEDKEKRVLKDIFDKIAEQIEKGEFILYIEDSKEFPSYLWNKVEIKKYLESLGYEVELYSSAFKREINRLVMYIKWSYGDI